MKRRPPENTEAMLQGMSKGSEQRDVQIGCEQPGLCELTLRLGPAISAHALGENFEAALLRAVRSSGLDTYSLCPSGLAFWEELALWELSQTDAMWLFAACELLRRGAMPWVVAEKAEVDAALLERCMPMIEREEAIRQLGRDGLTLGVLREAKTHGVSDKALWALTGMWDQEIVRLRRELGVVPRYRQQGVLWYACYGGGQVPSVAPGAVALLFDTLEHARGLSADLYAGGTACVWIGGGLSGECLLEEGGFGGAQAVFYEPFTFEDVENVLYTLGIKKAVLGVEGEEAERMALYLNDMGYDATTGDAIL